MQHIPVFYASDDNYAKPLAVSIASVVANTNEFVEFYILENKISDKNKKIIEQLKQKFDNFSIEYLTVDLDVFKDFPNIAWYSLNMYSRFLIAELKPEIKKAVYLDVDIVLDADIKQLFEVDLAGYVIAAGRGDREILKTPKFSEHLKKLNLSEKMWYLSSGQLVIDCEKWRQQGITKKLFEVINQKHEVLRYPDQDALNIVFDCAYKMLDERLNPCDYDFSQDWRTCQKHENPTRLLYHYDGNIKPWNINDCKNAETFWYYAKMTPVYKEMLKKSASSKDTSFKFLGIPLFSWEQKLKNSRLKLFNFLTLIKIKKLKNRQIISLLGVVPVCSIVKKCKQL